MAYPDPTGLEVVVELPRGPMQPRRLLDVTEGIPGANDGGTARWMNGVRWRAWPCRDLTIASPGTPCDSEILEATAEDLRGDGEECTDWLIQVPFRIDDAIINNVLEDTDQSYSRERIVDRYNQQISAAFASELISGVGSGGTSLSAVATEPESHPFGTAVPLVEALAHLEDEIGRRLKGAAGFILLPPGALSAAIGFGTTFDGQFWRTPAGNYLVSDAGFVDATEPDSETAAADGEAWIYASGQIFVESTLPKVLDSIDIDVNEFMLRNVGHGIIVFDPCPVTAVLAEYATS